MLREHHLLFKRLHLIADLAMIAVSIVVCRLVFEPDARALPLIDLAGVPGLFIPLGILGIVLGSESRVYQYRFRKLSQAISIIARAWMTSLALTLVVLFLFPPWAPSRPAFVGFAVCGVILLAANHAMVWIALNLYRRSGRSYKNIIIVGTGKLARTTADYILAQPGQGLRIIGFLDWDIKRRLWRYRDIPVIGTLADLPSIAKSRQIDQVVFAVGYRRLGRISGAVGNCNRMGLASVVLTDVMGNVCARRNSGEFFGRPGVQFEVIRHRDWATAAKSLLDRTLALLALIALSPLFAAVAVMIKCDSDGPVFYKQTRLGRNGRKFTLWKFRTMTDGADREKTRLTALNEMSGPVFKITDDPRITRLGRILRRTSVDELPQLFNVFRGEMSLVGPRPPLPEEVVRYDGWERRRLSVKPGLTCLWQIAGRNEIDFEDWMKLDLQYIDNWSLAKDAEILVKTIPAVLRGIGAR
jgi:exopolysaccharide biosynthesis polyprenyl glycosylphosphotransferase